MDTLTEDDRRQIEQIHSSWIEFEIAGASHHLITFCADDVEFFPPDTQPMCGRAEVAMHLEHGTKGIHNIEIGGRRIRGSTEIGYLTANYKTTFSSAEHLLPSNSLEAIYGYCKSGAVCGWSILLAGQCGNSPNWAVFFSSARERCQSRVRDAAIMQ